MPSRTYTTFGWTTLVAVIALLAGVTIAFVPGLAIDNGALFGPEQQALLQAVIIGLSIFGAAIVSVVLRLFLTEWSEFGGYEKTLALAESEMEGAEGALAGFARQYEAAPETREELKDDLTAGAA